MDSSTTDSSIGSDLLTNIVQWVESLKHFFTLPFLYKALSSLAIVIALYVLYRIILKVIRGLSKKRFKVQIAVISERIVKYVFWIFITLYVFDLFGVNLDALLGAAGIIGVAVGLAAQTSFSNIISGFFVLSENTIKVGDFVTIQDVVGTVHSIDLLSVKILTLNNQLIRVPNETLIKANVKNTTYFPVRRVTVAVEVAYDTNLDKAYKTLANVPKQCPAVIDEPAPIVYFESFGSSGIHMILAVWFKKADYIEAKNEVFMAVKKAFDKAKIEIPFNQIVIHDGDKNTGTQ